MSKNERGFLLIDATAALFLVMIMLMLITCAFHVRARLIQTKENSDIYEIYEAGTRIYYD